MGFLKSVVYDGQMQRQIGPGDILAGGEVLPATNATQNITVTGAMLANGYLLRSNGAAMADTIDSAANLIAAFNSGIGNQGLQPGTTFKVRWIVTTAFAVTVAATANTGVTVNRGTVAASSAKDFLVTIVNGTPAQVFAGTTVNASAVVSGFTSAQLAQLTVGMVVTNAVAGLQGTTVIAINQAAGTVTFSGNANATNITPVAINFSPVVQLDGLAP